MTFQSNFSLSALLILNQKVCLSRPNSLLLPRVEAVFSLELLTLRGRLRELTGKLVSQDPVQLGTKALEVRY